MPKKGNTGEMTDRYLALAFSRLAVCGRFAFAWFLAVWLCRLAKERLRVLLAFWLGGVTWPRRRREAGCCRKIRL